MKKYGSPAEAEVFSGKEAQLVNDYFQKTGKRAVSDFSEDEKKDFQKDLAALKEEPEEDEQSS